MYSRSSHTRIRRSSTSRSIGNRSSFGTSVNGDKPNESAVDGTGSAADGEEGEERERRRSVANQHVANYVNDQLERVRSNESVATYEDEFEAQLDGK